MHKFSHIPQIGRYQLEGELMRGGFATVYRARDMSLDRPVALKILHPYWVDDPDFVARFRREARAAAGLLHPNIVTIYDTGEADGQLYIAMAYVHGRTLQTLLSECRVLTLEQALPILAQTAAALDYAHAQGVIHRDVKPNNIMLTETARGFDVTLVDFGLVKALESSTALTSVGSMLGTPEYMAPEQANPNLAVEVGAAVDRYALGVVAYRMLTGRVPFPGSTPGTLNAHATAPVPPPRLLCPELPAGVSEALLRMLAKSPESRFARCGDFMVQLGGGLAPELAPAPEPSPVWRKPRVDVPTVAAPTGELASPSTGGTGVTRWLAPWDAARLPVQSLWLSKGFRAGGWALGLLLVLSALVYLLSGGLGRLEMPWAALHPAHRGDESTAVSTPNAAFSPPTTNVLPTAVPHSLVPPAPVTGATWTRPVDNMQLVGAPAGKFAQGSQDYGIDEQPVHVVTLDGFWLDQTEVTNAQFAAFLTAFGNRSAGGTHWLELERDYVRIRQENDSFVAQTGYAEHPVVGVSWYGAQAYCAWVGGALPTEAQWEYAARGSDGRFYPWGSAAPDCTRANYWGQAGGCAGGPAAVGSYPDGAAWTGALDMAGNVWEWVADWHAADYYGRSPDHNPQGPESGSEKVLRGGGWSHHAASLRAALRQHEDPAFRSLNVGFRCAMAPGE